MLSDDLVVFEGRHKDLRMPVRARTGLACDILTQCNSKALDKKMADATATPVHAPGGGESGVPSFLLIEDDVRGFVDMATMMITRCVTPARHIVLLKMDRVGALFEVLKRGVSFADAVHKKNDGKGTALRCLVVFSRTLGLDVYVLASSDGVDDDIRGVRGDGVATCEGSQIRVHFPPFNSSVEDSRLATLASNPPRALVVARMTARPLPTKLFVMLRPDVTLVYGGERHGFWARLANQSWSAGVIRLTCSKWRFPEGASVAVCLQDGDLAPKQPTPGGHSGFLLGGLSWWLPVDSPLTYHHKRKRAALFYRTLRRLSSTLRAHPAPPAPQGAGPDREKILDLLVAGPGPPMAMMAAGKPGLVSPRRTP